ncbi:DNA mismatch repair endonuclease MutH [Glaciecola sp. XM2]|uniref:DNA mismatch repair endonuclease MutH n=1 Tax=Glaciecola sp. XM2 TaxID=1914931 RepID=UPI001BDF1BE0|nr:DNA mismatch repair endonuclease MutH [Glaciecola sp. XM2]MBT1452189.1 DNA mismatch repair endonuclease MutH [Glaciecola sp. XM2]
MIENKPAAPESESVLLNRTKAIAGMSFKELADELNIQVPENFKRHKGWTGQLLEIALGASAGSKAQQDFVDLGIELKTLPLSYDNTPLETTYVCYAPLTNLAGITWHTSNVKNKLQKVLWVPIQGEREIPVAERIIGSAFMWEPTAEQNAYLQQDWEELMDLIVLGKVETINARMGQMMQLRPKAANGKALTQAIGEDGTIIQTRPRGFYLRKEMTQMILDAHFR